MPRTLKDIHGELEERRKRLDAIFVATKQDDGTYDLTKADELKGLKDDTARVEALKDLMTEADDLAKEAEPLVEKEAQLKRLERTRDQLEQLKGRPGFAAPDLMDGLDGSKKAAQKSIGELFVDAKVGTERKGETVELPDVEVKTLFQTSAGWEPETIRTGRLVDFATRPIQVIDLIPSGSTSQAAVVYMEETTFTNAAAETAEAGTYPEAALALTERSEPVRKIAVWIPVTDEQLEDVPQAQGYVNNRLPFMLRQRLDGQIVVGDGTAPNLSGFLDRSGLQTQAKGADPTPDAVYKAGTKVRVTGRAIPGGVIMHPNDWQDIRLLRTADGIYIWGNPSDPGPERIFGWPVAQADSITEGTALIGDFAAFSELTMRRGIELKVSDSHGTFFVEGKQAIRADMRAALCVYRPSAFCQITGI